MKRKSKNRSRKAKYRSSVLNCMAPPQEDFGPAIAVPPIPESPEEQHSQFSFHLWEKEERKTETKKRKPKEDLQAEFEALSCSISPLKTINIEKNVKTAKLLNQKEEGLIKNYNKEETTFDRNKSIELFKNGLDFFGGIEEKGVKGEFCGFGEGFERNDNYSELKIFGKEEEALLSYLSNDDEEEDNAISVKKPDKIFAYLDDKTSNKMFEDSFSNFVLDFSENEKNKIQQNFKNRLTQQPISNPTIKLNQSYQCVDNKDFLSHSIEMTIESENPVKKKSKKKIKKKKPKTVKKICEILSDLFNNKFIDFTNTDFLSYEISVIKNVLLNKSKNPNKVILLSNISLNKNCENKIIFDLLQLSSSSDKRKDEIVKLIYKQTVKILRKKVSSNEEFLRFYFTTASIQSKLPIESYADPLQRGSIKNPLFKGLTIGFLFHVFNVPAFKQDFMHVTKTEILKEDYQKKTFSKFFKSFKKLNRCLKKADEEKYPRIVDDFLKKEAKGAKFPWTDRELKNAVEIFEIHVEEILETGREKHLFQGSVLNK